MFLILKYIGFVHLKNSGTKTALYFCTNGCGLYKTWGTIEPQGCGE